MKFNYINDRSFSIFFFSPAPKCLLLNRTDEFMLLMMVFLLLDNEKRNGTFFSTRFKHRIFLIKFL